MWKSIKYLGSLTILVAMAACQSDYTRMVNAELAKGIRKDSVLLGISLGDTRQEFYGKCFALNKQHLISPGSGGNTVQYIFTDSTVHKTPQEIKMEFVPAFDDHDRITNIDIKFSYSGWAPWNNHLQSDSLEIKLKQLLMSWYGGNDFVMAKEGDKEIPVKVDGNRRVVMYKSDPQNVVVHVQDILHPKFKHTKDGEGKEME